MPSLRRALSERENLVFRYRHTNRIGRARSVAGLTQSVGVDSGDGNRVLSWRSSDIAEMLVAYTTRSGDHPSQQQPEQ